MAEYIINFARSIQLLQSFPRKNEGVRDAYLFLFYYDVERRHFVNIHLEADRRVVNNISRWYIIG